MLAETTLETTVEAGASAGLIGKIIGVLAGFIISGISTMGYSGIVLMMAIESACIPLPSEIIMPFSGYLVAQGRFTLFWVSFAGALGCLVGSIPTYFVGLYGGRPLLEKYGKYVLISHHDMEIADKFFAKYGDLATFISRLLPVVRTFISLPSGIAKTNFPKFCFYTFIGSFLWCWFLAWVGLKMGEHWNTLGVYFHRFDAVIGIIILAGAIWYVRRHLKQR
ncbi:MAG: alkaline phosphatase [Candidatus Firestonebacteria bacterium RIFOXYA2_FULL_40_8]|nr:MAG: alkaline phosphatase [Candidatus Firestonebacteria bacterium RIFOXYA2_FULL_40_8]